MHTVLQREFRGFDKRVRLMARNHVQARLLMTTPAVGPIVALTYVGAIDDPARFSSSKQIGAHFGLTPKSINRDRLITPDGSARSAMPRCARRFTKPPM